MTSSSQQRLHLSENNPPVAAERPMERMSAAADHRANSLRLAEATALFEKALALAIERTARRELASRAIGEIQQI